MLYAVLAFILLWEIVCYIIYRLSGFFLSGKYKCKIRWRDIVTSYSLSPDYWRFTNVYYSWCQSTAMRHLIYRKNGNEIIVILSPLSYEKIKLYSWIKDIKDKKRDQAEIANIILDEIRR